MPRGPRLDAPGVLHHVMARGIERQLLFRNDTDRDDFVRRLAALAETEAWSVYAWALMPNHFHLLVRTATVPLARSMRSLLTGYAGAFNRRHHRRGHLLQNRYKSIVCEEETYFLELVRYLHLNPLRAGIVPDLDALAAYPYSGHAVLLGKRLGAWQDTVAVLGRFATERRRARHKYALFVAEGVAQGRRPELQGGGLVRSAGGWAAVRALRRGREGYAADERILGCSEFVERLRQEVDTEARGQGQGQKRPITLEHLLAKVCQAEGVRIEEVGGGGRRAVLCRVREGVAYLWIERLGHSGPPAAAVLGIRPPVVYRVARRGQRAAERWQRVLETF
jgi:REP-associated tyrosine transposase